MRSIFIALALVCGTTSLSAQGRAADETSIRAHAVAISNALNKRDAAALALLFTQDGDEINGDGPRVAGREAMRRSAAADLAKWTPTMKFTLAVTGIRFLGQDVAIVGSVRFASVLLIAFAAELQSSRTITTRVAVLLRTRVYRRRCTPRGTPPAPQRMARADRSR